MTELKILDNKIRLSLCKSENRIPFRNVIYGPKQPRIVHIRARVMPDKMFVAPVDINNERIGDLKRKLAIAMDIPAYKFRLIHKGHHLENNDCRLFEINLSEHDILGICTRLIHDKNDECCFVSYNMLCDAYARKTIEPLKGLNGSEFRMLISNLSNVSPKDETTKMLAENYFKCDMNGPEYARNIVLPNSPSISDTEDYL
jgi:hypothetical protein